MNSLCVYSALLYCIAQRVTQEYATRVLETTRTRACLRMRELSQWVRVHAKGIGLRRYAIPKNPTSWMKNTKSGVFIAELLGTHDVKHVVCFNFQCGWVLDAEDEHPMRIEDGVLDVCCGNGSSFLNFHVIREITGKIVSERRG